MQINPYLSFKGDCEKAFKFYEQYLGGQLGKSFAMLARPWPIKSLATGKTK